MQLFLIAALTMFVSGHAQAEDFSERTKVIGFECNDGKAAIQLRSFESDRVLYLAEDKTGEPHFLQVHPEYCEGLIKNLRARLTGKIFEADFRTERFLRKGRVYVPPRNPCGLRGRRLKCEDDGHFVEKILQYERIETVIDEFRFFNEQRTNDGVHF